jgi:hypothetical protein
MLIFRAISISFLKELIMTLLNEMWSLQIISAQFLEI